MTTRLGVLLPHFGSLATRRRVIDGSVELESLGFDSVWARDNLMFRSYQLEPAGTRFMDPYTTLSAIAAVTDRLLLGISVIVPIRHPLIVSQLLGGLVMIAGEHRLIIGVGAGGQEASFSALGLDFHVRVPMVREMVDVFRQVWGREAVSYRGNFYRFDDVTIDPSPPGDTPIFYGGSTPASVRRALEFADGWLPGRCPLRTFDERLDQLRAARDGRRMRVGIIPVVSIARDREEALRKVNADGFLQAAQQQRWWRGPFSSADDLRGLVVAGTPIECIDEIRLLIARGVDHIVFDFRMRREEYDEQLAWFARDVLPALKEIR